MKNSFFKTLFGFVIFIQSIFGQTNEIKVPNYLYDCLISVSRDRIDSLFKLGWNECLDRLKHHKYHFKFCGLPKESQPIFEEILKAEFGIIVDYTIGDVILENDYFFCEGFNKCIYDFTIIKYKRNVFEYADSLADASLPTIEAYNMDTIVAQLVYPSLAKDQKIEGKVIVGGILDKDGFVKKMEVLKGLGFGCDDEALRLVAMLRFLPAKQTPYRRDLGKICIPIEFIVH